MRHIRLRKSGSIFYLSAALASLVLMSGVQAHESAADLVANALIHGERPAADAEDDGRRMPLEVLAFAGIQKGMNIFEMEAGAGYYTEILSRVVGPAGSVVMQNPPSFDSFFGDQPEQRVARLDNVRLSKTNFDALEAADNSMDMVTWILGPHELWFAPDGNSLGDPTTAFAEIVRILKPGGLFLAIDHDARPGAGPEVGGTLHRVPVSIVRDYAETAGLVELRSSNLHVNNADPLDIGVFDPAIQGQTDKFVILFRK